MPGFTERAGPAASRPPAGWTATRRWRLRLRQAADVGEDGLVADSSLAGLALPVMATGGGGAGASFRCLARRHRCIRARLSLPSMNDDGPAAAPLTNSRQGRGAALPGVDHSPRRHHRPTRRGMTEQTMADEGAARPLVVRGALHQTRPMATPAMRRRPRPRQWQSREKSATKVRAGDVVEVLIAERERRGRGRSERSKRALGHRPRRRATSTTARRRSSERSRPASWPSVARAGRASALSRARGRCGGAGGG